MSCGKSTHKIFYTQTLLHMVLFHKHTLTHRRFDTQKPLHTNAFTHRRFYTQTLLHTDAFTHKSFYTQTVLHTDASARRRFYAQMRFTHAHALSHTNAFTHRRVYTQTLLHTNAFTHIRFYTRTLLHANTFTYRRFYTQTLSHSDTFTHRRFSTQTLLHTDAFTTGWPQLQTKVRKHSCNGNAKKSQKCTRPGSVPWSTHNPMQGIRSLRYKISSAPWWTNLCQGIQEPFTTPGHSTATQLLQPNFHGIGRRGWRGRVLHSHGHSLQQMKQRPQNVHKRHGCVTSTKPFAFRNFETCIFVRLLSKQCHDMLDFKTKLNGTKLNGTMIPVVFFCPVLMHFNENITYIFSCYTSHRSTAS